MAAHPSRSNARRPSRLRHERQNQSSCRCPFRCHLLACDMTKKLMPKKLMPKKLMPWGRFASSPQTPHTCHWRSDLPNLLTQLAKNHSTILPFGNGRSYGDSCLAASDHVLHLRSLDRFISADWENGIIAAESGTTLEELLSIAIPRGWFLPIVPGTKFVTLGGALANDIHGKNHHRRGTFGQHVTRFSLVRSDRPPLL